MIEQVVGIFIGIFVGIFTGLFPGVHINLVSATLVSFSPVILKYVSPITASLFIISMSITHSFLDFIPSTFLGAPNAETSVSLLPAHSLLHQGRAKEAIFFSVLGAFSGLILAIVLAIPVTYLVKFLYNIMKDYIPVILVGIVFFLIMREKKKGLAFMISILIGIFGYIVLNARFVNDPLMPLFSGMYGVSGILKSLNDKVTLVKQNLKIKYVINKARLALLSLKCLVSACFTCPLPGLSASHTVLLTSYFVKETTSQEVLFLNGFVNAAGMVLSLLTFFSIAKARNGSIIAIKELLVIDQKSLLILIAGVLINCFFSLFLALKCSELAAKYAKEINYKRLSYIILGVIVCLNVLLCGFYGLIVLFIATFVGFLPVTAQVSRKHLMSSLIIPIIIYSFW